MFVLPLAGAAPSPVVPVVTITGATISSAGNGLTNAILWITIDGTLWKQTRLGSVQLSPGTDWIIPHEDADSSYEVRYTNHTGTEIVHSGDISVEGTWVALTVTQLLSIFTADDEIPVTCTFDLQIRKDGGPVLATGTFTLNATRFTGPGEFE